MALFDVALEKRFDDSAEIALIDVSGSDCFLIKDIPSGTIMKLPMSVLTSAIAAALGSTFEPSYSAGTTAQYWRGDKSWQTLNKAAVGLGSVDNTADSAKSVNYAATAGAAPASDVYAWAKASVKPTYTKTEVGLSNLSNDAQLKIASNLSDVASAATSRTNLGLGTAALQAYSESTYTPTWNGGTLTVNKAVVTQIGQLVIVQIDVLLGSSASGTAAQVTLPETPDAGFHIGVMNFTSYSTTISPNIDSAFGANVAFRYDQTAGNLTCAQLTGARLVFTAIYTK